MKDINRTIFSLISFVLINIINCHFKHQPIFKCEHNVEEERNPLHNFVIERTNKEKEEQRRRISDETDEEGFKEFNIYLDLENIKNDIVKYGLQEHEDFFISSMEKTVDVLKSLLKVKPLKYGYALTTENFRELNIEKYNTEIFGDEAINNHKSFKTEGIDLAIFGILCDLGESTLATASAKAFQEKEKEEDPEVENRGQPYVGVVRINRHINYNLPNSKAYFQAILVHEFTHILGFSKNFFEKYYKNIYSKQDSFGVMRTYLNSTKLLEVARKYYNCPTLEGVELENQGGNGTEGSHWEARILLGEYMNGYAYTEEMVISEFTLAVLEDSKYYKANYYTGGLMRYGKHKGCEFLEQQCIDPQTHKMNPKFENEFFDSLSKRIDQYSEYSVNLDASCSSGRQSRTYNIFWETNNISDVPEEYRYYANPKTTGYQPADYCPTPMKYQVEEDLAYFSGHCSKKGSGFYGGILEYYSPDFNASSGVLAYATGEKLSEQSFCFLSSLTKSSAVKSEFISRVVRANCYEIFCSEKSLTLKIFEDYIVCPRAGGKIKVEGYNGYLLCPDYNLMCSGSVICNDIFDCVEKKSVIKDTDYTYDYEIKTSQNIEKSKTSQFETDNYELSTNGRCPINCKHCKEEGVCFKCRDDFDFALQDDGTKKCFPLTDLKIGYFKNQEIDAYEKCMANCNFCDDKTSCKGCAEGYIYKQNTCEYNPDKAIPNCFAYDEHDLCTECNPTYAFKETYRDRCLSLETELKNYYTKDNYTYYPCSQEKEHCSKCYYEKSIFEIVCQECDNDLVLLVKKDEEGIETSCYAKEEIENKTNYYYINETHAGRCEDAFSKCISCENDTYCLKCRYGYLFVEEDINGTEIRQCLKRAEAEKIIDINKGNDTENDSDGSDDLENSYYLSIRSIFMLQIVYIIFLLIKF